MRPPISPAVPDVEELAILDDSTAPTTPEGSLSFSPALRPQDDVAYLNLQSRINGPSLSLSSALFSSTAQAPRVVRNICCIGAGFVGELPLSPARSSARPCWPLTPDTPLFQEDQPLP